MTTTARRITFATAGVKSKFAFDTSPVGRRDYSTTVNSDSVEKSGSLPPGMHFRVKTASSQTFSNEQCEPLITAVARPSKVSPVSPLAAGFSDDPESTLRLAVFFGLIKHLYKKNWFQSQMREDFFEFFENSLVGNLLIRDEMLEDAELNF